MILFRLINLFTNVVIVFTAVSFWSSVNAFAQSSSEIVRKYGTYENCVARYDGPVRDGEDCTKVGGNQIYPVSGTGYSRFDDKEKCRQYNARKFCNTISWPDPSARSECMSMLKDFQSNEAEAIEKCSEAGYGSNALSCAAKTATCRKNLDINPTRSDDPTAAMNNLMRQWMMTANAGSPLAGGADPSGCQVVDRERERQRQEQIEDKIARLLEQNEDSEVKKAELDDEVTQRQEEVEEKIREAEEEVNRKKIERQTRQQEEENRIQKEILESQKKQFANLRQIDEKNMEISNLQFAQQQINIQFAKTAIDRKCEVAAKAKEKELTAPPPPAPGASPTAKPKAVKFSRKESIKIKAEIDRTFKECWDLEELGKSAQLKGLMDKRAKLQADIDTLNRANEDEQKAIELDKKAVEDMKATMAKEEQNDLDNKLKKINTLSASLAKFKESIDKKKKSQDQRMLARKEQIARLISSKSDVIYKEIEVDRPLAEYESSKANFQDFCCRDKLDSRFTKVCGDIKSSTGSGGYRRYGTGQ